jgi:tetratricopeptide (TPR) repeat protein
MIRNTVLLTLLIGVVRLAADDPPATALGDLAVHERSVQVREQALGPDDPGLAPLLARITQLHLRLGDYPLAEASAQRSVAILASQGLEQSFDGGIALTNLAMVYRLRDRLPEAESLYRRSVEILRPLSRPVDTAAAINNLGTVVLAKGRWKEARALYLEAISLWQANLGPETVESAAGMTNLALLYQSRRQYGKAGELLERAMKIDQAVYPPHHPRIALDRVNQAALAAGQKRYAEAERMLRQSLESLQASLPPGHPDIGITESNLAEVCRRERHYEDAEKFYRAGIAILEKAWGPDDRRLLSHFQYYAAALRAREEFAEAARADLRATRIRVVHTLR